MEDLFSKVVYVGIVSMVTSAIGFLWWLVKRDKEKLENHGLAIEQLKAECVTEDEVRQIVVECINPVSQDLQEIKALSRSNNDLIKAMQLEMAEQKGYEKALKEIRNNT